MQRESIVLVTTDLLKRADERPVRSYAGYSGERRRSTTLIR